MGASASKHKTHGSKRDINRIPDRPSQPGKPQLVPGTTHSEPDVVTIKWEPPEYDGGAKVTGYLVEHRRTGSPHWVRASPQLVRVPELTLSGLEPGWRYQFRVSARNAIGMSEPGELSELLTVTLQRTAASAPHFIKELTDIVALENEKAELTVEIRGTPAPTVAWYKDGLEIFSGRRHRIITENGTSTLVIHQTALSDEGEIKCAATNRVGHAVTKANIRMEAPPSIRLPRQYEDGLLFEKDEVMRLKVTIAGKPEPSISWLHNGEPLINSGRYEMAFSDKHSTLRINEARRSDRGEYQVKAVNNLGEDIASFLVTVTDRPQSPGKAKVVMTLGRSVTLSWTPPEDDGGCKIGNYIVEYYRLGWNMWLKAATCRQLTTNLGDLIEGSEYKFRVKAENPYGVSDPGEESDILFIPDPHRGLLTPPERREGTKDVTDVGIEEWLLDPHKRQREMTPGGSPSRDYKKVKKKPEAIDDRGRTPDRLLHSEKTLLHEDVGHFPDIIKSTDPNVHYNKEQQDAPMVPKRRAKRKQQTVQGNEDSEEITQKKHLKVTDLGKPERKMIKREKSDDLHGSSELMLVLLPNSRATTEERESTRKEIIDSLKDESPGIAPPMSLSAPELGTIELERPMQRPWVSSTELLHEKAMARFYQEVAEEEQEKALTRRYSFERRSSSRGREILPQLVQRNKSTNDDDTENVRQKSRNRLSLPGDFEMNDSSTAESLMKNDTYSPNENIDDRYNYFKKYVDNSQANTNKDKIFQQQYSEEEELKSEQEGMDENVEGSDLEEEEEEYVEETEEEEEEGEYDMMDDNYEEEESYEEEEEIDDEDDTDLLGSSEINFSQRPLYSVEEDTYHPRNMTPRSGTFTSLPSTSSNAPGQKMKPQKNISENLQKVTDVATVVVSHSIQIPVKSSTLKPPQVRPIVRIEVTPPPSDDIQNKDMYTDTGSKHKMTKRTNKKGNISVSPEREVSPIRSKISVSNIGKLDRSPSPYHYSPPRFTPDGRHLPNPNPPIPKPILKNREHSQERTLDDGKGKTTNGNGSAPLAIVEPELNLITRNEKTESNRYSPNKSDNNTNGADSAKLRKKQVRIEEPIDSQRSYTDQDEIDLSLAGDVARNRRRSRSNSLLEATADPTKCLIHHYSDIVREFGHVRKVPTTLYLNYEDLKAAAQKSEEPEITTENYKKEIDKETQIKETEFSNSEKRREDNTERNGSYELKESKEIQKLPNLILLSDLKTEVSKKEIQKEEKEIVDEDTKFSKYESEEEEEEEEEEKSISSVVRDENDVTVLAEKKIRSLVDYMTDVAMFVIACYLYAFSDERLAIPILILMIYRQAKNATVSYVKRQIAKLPKLPKLPKIPKFGLPWRKDN